MAYHHFNFYKSIGNDLNSTPKVGFSEFHFVLLVLDSQEEKNHQLIILRVWNIISSMFILISMNFSCWIEDTKSTQNLQALKGVF